MEEKSVANNKIVSGAFWKFGERIIAQGVSFIVSLVLARLLTPDDYGAVAVVNIFIEIANVILISGLNTALIQKKDITQEETSTIFYCSAILSVVLYVVMFFAAPLIASVYQLPILIPVIRVFSLRLPMSALQSVQAALLSRNMDFKKYFFSTIGGTAVSAVVGIAMAIAGCGVWALVAQTLTGTLIGAIILCFTVRWRPSWYFSLKTAKPLLSYGWKIMAVDLMGTVFNNLSSMLIGVRYTSADLAYYTKGKQVPYLIRNNIYNTILGVLFPAMARVGDDNNGMKNLASKSISTLAYVIFPMMAGMIAVSDRMVVFLYTQKWSPMVPFVCIVCAESMLSIVPTISLLTLKSAGYSDVMLKMEFIKKPILFISIAVAMRYGVVAVALTLPLNTLLDMLINAFFTRKYIEYTLSEQLKALMPAALLSAAMGIIVWLMGQINLPVLPVLILQVLAGATVYVVLSVCFKVKTFYSLLRLVRGKLLKK
jgi:O-antigen/teichoic acid export membrane protein